MKLIALSKRGKKNAGKYFAKVDDEDYEWLNQWNWQVSFRKGVPYAVRGVFNGRNMSKISMHRLILNCLDETLLVDHIYHDTLDNQRANIRISTISQNQMNKISRPNSTSKYKGVSWCKNHNNWAVYIRMNGKAIWIGRFDIEIEAAKAYDKKAKELFGEFALYNFEQSNLLTNENT